MDNTVTFVRYEDIEKMIEADNNDLSRDQKEELLQYLNCLEYVELEVTTTYKVVD